MIYSLRRGSTTPTTENLNLYELGWETANKRLYIRDNGNIVRLNTKVTLNGLFNSDPDFYAPTAVTANRVLKSKASWTIGSDPFEYVAVEISGSSENSGDLITSGAVYSDITNLQSVINEALLNKVDKAGDVMSGELELPSIKLTNVTSGAGKIYFDDIEGVPQVELTENVKLAVGIDIVKKVYNQTGSDLIEGQFVCYNGNINGVPLVALSDATDLIKASGTIGSVTEPIPNNSYGFINLRGYVGNIIIDPAIYNPGDKIYLSTTTAGAFTKTKPMAPNHIVELGYVNKVSSDNLTADGQIYVKIVIIPIAEDISYDNSDSFINSQTVKGALDELSLGKVDIGALSSNITLYPTTANSGIPNYYRMVSSIEDPDYNVVAANINSSVITSTNQLIASLAADPNIFVGNPGVINISTIGNIRKVGGNSTQYAEFFFKLYHRDENGVETLVGTSGTTGAINPSDNNYYQFNATAELNNGDFLSTDRLVIKYYANMIGNSGSVYDFQFGGDTPIRSLLPVPVSVIPIPLASAIITDVTNFDGILSSSDTNIQSALNTLNDHNHDNRYLLKTDLEAGTLAQANAGTDTDQKTWAPNVLKNAITDLSSRIYIQSENPGEPANTDSVWFHI